MRCTIIVSDMSSTTYVNIAYFLLLSKIYRCASPATVSVIVTVVKKWFSNYDCESLQVWKRNVAIGTSVQLIAQLTTAVHMSSVLSISGVAQ